MAMSDTATRLRQLRKLRDLNQEEVAAAVSCDRSMVSLIEAGRKKAGLDLVVRLAEFYGVSVDWLLHGNGTAEGAITPPLNPLEIQVLETLRKLPEDQAQMMLRMLQAAVKAK